MSKTLEEQMVDALGKYGTVKASPLDTRTPEEIKAHIWKKPAKRCVKVAKIYALEQQIGTLMTLRAALIYKKEKISYLLDYQINQLEEQLKSLKDGKE